ncbi:hypothetical protein COCNU_scaffold005506G000010 [Cocos nucifera]|nr:hypothetical protein [Cocos nucifera]
MVSAMQLAHGWEHGQMSAREPRVEMVFAMQLARSLERVQMSAQEPKVEMVSTMQLARGWKRGQTSYLVALIGVDTEETGGIPKDMATVISSIEADMTDGIQEVAQLGCSILSNADVREPRVEMVSAMQLAHGWEHGQMSAREPRVEMVFAMQLARSLERVQMSAQEPKVEMVSTMQLARGWKRGQTSYLVALIGVDTEETGGIPKDMATVISSIEADMTDGIQEVAQLVYSEAELDRGLVPHKA